MCCSIYKDNGSSEQRVPHGSCCAGWTTSVTRVLYLPTHHRTDPHRCCTHPPITEWTPTGAVPIHPSQNGPPHAAGASAGSQPFSPPQPPAPPLPPLTSQGLLPGWGPSAVPPRPRLLELSLFPPARGGRTVRPACTPGVWPTPVQPSTWQAPPSQHPQLRLPPSVTPTQN